MKKLRKSEATFTYDEDSYINEFDVWWAKWLVEQVCVIPAGGRILERLHSGESDACDEMNSNDL